MEYPLSQLAAICPLNDEFIKDLTSRIRRLEPAKNHRLLLSGDICRDLYLIEKGMLACFDIDGKKRYCSWIMTEGDFVTAVDSFNNQVISTEIMVALKNSVLWAITKQDFDHLTAKHDVFGRIRQVLTDKYHIQSRVMDAKRKRPPEQFFDYLRDNYPRIVNEAPHAVLASLMGITRTTLYEILKKQ